VKATAGTQTSVHTCPNAEALLLTWAGSWKGWQRFSSSAENLGGQASHIQQLSHHKLQNVTQLVFLAKMDRRRPLEARSSAELF
jgi:hypothetical protein